MAATESATTGGPPVDLELARELVRKLIAAWNSHQADQLLALMSENVVYDDASWTKQMHGRQQVREFLESTWRAVPDLSFEFEDVTFNPVTSQIAHYWRATATQTGVWDPPGLQPAGQPLRLEGMFLGEVSDGMISRIRVVYDVANVMRQAGILPAPGSWGERAIIAMANLRLKARRR